RSPRTAGVSSAPAGATAPRARAAPGLLSTGPDVPGSLVVSPADVVGGRPSDRCTTLGDRPGRLAPGARNGGSSGVPVVRRPPRTDGDAFCVRPSNGSSNPPVRATRPWSASRAPTRRPEPGSVPGRFAPGRLAPGRDSARPMPPGGVSPGRARAPERSTPGFPAGASPGRPGAAPARDPNNPELAGAGGASPIRRAVSADSASSPIGSGATTGAPIGAGGGVNACCCSWSARSVRSCSGGGVVGVGVAGGGVAPGGGAAGGGAAGGAAPGGGDAGGGA